MAKKTGNKSTLNYAGAGSLAFDYLETVVAREMELTCRVFGVQTQTKTEQARFTRGSASDARPRKKVAAA